jgi:hypothetical protein
MQCGQTIQADSFAMLKRAGLHWRNTVIWHYTFGPHQKRKFVPSWQGAAPHRKLGQSLQ